MAPYHIHKYQESNHKWIPGLFSRGMEEDIPATFQLMLTLPQILLLLLGVPLALLLMSDSWLPAVVCCFILLLFLWLLASYPWKKHVDACLHTHH
jgi:hypothetical protein|uniref:Uncharacterized protein n=1 Tax=Castor canadensis TaxID=51338 RepID=A0A8C0VUZ5_CASCN